jgi:outer membrane protein assembly factor BamB
MRFTPYLLASLFSALCAKPGGTSNSSPGHSSGPSSPSVNAGLHGGNPNARSLQIDSIHSGTIAGTLVPPLVSIWTKTGQSASTRAGALYAPIVTGSAVYLLYNSASGSQAEMAALHALDPFDGSELWPPITVDDDSMGIALNDGIITLTTSSGTVEAFDETTGAQKWKITFPFMSPSLEAPVMGNGLVYVSDLGDQGHLVAFDEKTGTQKWSVASPGHGFGLPAVTSTAVYVLEDVALHAFDQGSGMPLWTGPSTMHGFCDAPVTAFGSLVFSQIDGVTATTADITKGTPSMLSFKSDVAGAFDGPNAFLVNSGIGNLTSYAPGTGKSNWVFAGGQRIAQSPLIVNGVVYTYAQDRISLDGYLFATAEADGTELWEDPHALFGGSFNASYETGFIGASVILAGMGSDGKVLVVPTPSGIIAYTSPEILAEHSTGLDGGQ